MVKRLLLMSYLLLVACNNNKEVVIKTTNDFFHAIKSDKQGIINNIYPDMDKLGSYWKSDKIEIKRVQKLKNKEYSVNIDSYFTNGFGKSDIKEITLFLKRKSGDNDEYVIYDSKNLGALFNRDEDSYYYAIQVGAIDEMKDETDQTIANKMLDVNMMMMFEKLELVALLQKTVTVSSWYWEYSSYSNGANGEALFVNNSGMDIPTPKWEIEWKNKNGTVVATDRGYITYDTFRNGTKEHVSFHSSYIARARKASISLYIDNTLNEKIYEYIARKKHHSGNEYRDYLQMKSQLSGNEQRTPSPMMPTDSI